MRFPILTGLLVTAVAFLSLRHASAQSATPLAQQYVEVFHNPDPEYYVEGPGLSRLDDGTLFTAVPVVPRVEWSAARRVEHSAIHLLRSTDSGKSWKECSQLPYYSAVPWTYRGVLYLFANKPGAKSRNDDLLLLKSQDGGVTWSEPVTLFKGHYWNCHTGMVIKGDRLYWAVDDLALGQKRGPRAIVGDLSQDPMNPATWRISEPVPFPGIPEALTAPKFAAESSQYLEPNVIAIGDQLRVLATVKPHKQSTPGLCAILDLRDDGTKLDLKFAQYHPMPGGQLKFRIVRDETSKLFWATANLVVDAQRSGDFWEQAERDKKFWSNGTGGNDRRFLMLLYSLDGLNWFQAGCIAQAAKLSQSFMYAAPIIDGDDLVLVARSSVHAPNQHDADYATFHRVKDFRKLALKLVPDPE